LKETILIVDDEPHIRRILDYLLRQQGYEVEAAASGPEALDRIQGSQHLPDLILLDLMMPEMDGFEVCRRLRDDYRSRQIPIIIVTAKGEQIDRVRGLEGGANDYLTKPYDHKELVLRVRNTLEWSRAQRQANPLTGLPGNRAIEQEVQGRIDREEAFSFLYLDIDNFKAYNDFYGYSRGDSAIRVVAELLRDASREHGGDSDFVGHIGGDDFCVVTEPELAKDLGDAIVARFAMEFLKLIDAKDLDRGFLEVRARQGGLLRVDFPSLTIAVVTDPGKQYEHWGRVSDAAAELKSFGKTQTGSIVVTERRDPVPEDSTEPVNERSD
jgi:diguanylate cyclase (GGDEF)-like protein